MTASNGMMVAIVLIILCITAFPLSNSFSAEKRFFTDDDLEAYRYGNGKTESVLTENDNVKPSPEVKPNMQEQEARKDAFYKSRLKTITTNLKAAT